MDVELPALFHDLVRLETELWNRADARLRAEHGLLLSWLEVMRMIDSIPECRVIDIADSLFITVGGASKLVDRIEGAGLATRNRNPGDGRSNFIELTPAGRRRLDDGRSTLADQLDKDLGSAATPAQLQALAATVVQLRSALAMTAR